MDGTSSPEQGNAIEQERIKAFIQELMKTGKVELVSPPTLQDKQFFLTYRLLPHKQPLRSGVAVNSSTVFGPDRWNGVTDHIMIDLFEKNPKTEELESVPIGHIDYRVARFSDKTVANGNKSTRDSCVVDMKKDTLFQKTDTFWGVNGIDVLSNRRGVGFGGLLNSVGLLVLEKSGVEELDFHGDFSGQNSNLRNVGFIPGSLRQPVVSFNQETISAQVKPFIK